MSIPIGVKIKHLRKKQRLTLEQLAQKIDSGKSYVWELENRGVTRPSADKIAKVALALGVTSEYLMDEEKETPDDNTIDSAYFRKYQKLKPSTKKRIQQMIDLWENE